MLIFEIIMGIVLFVPVYMWLDSRIHFIKYPSYVKFSDYLRRRDKLWILWVEKLLVLGLIGGLVYYTPSIIAFLYK